MTKTFRTIIVAAAFWAAWPSCQPVSAGGAGATSANFLKIPAAALPSGMGEAYTAMVGPDSILYNPAGLGLLGYSSFSGSHNQYIDGITQEYLALAWRSPYGTVGAAFTALSSGDIDAYDSSDMRIGNTSSAHRVLAVSYARSWPRFNKDIGMLDPMLITSGWTNVPLVKDYRPRAYRFSIGGGVKRVSEKLGKDSASSYAFDAGALLVLPRHFHVGVSAMNFGGREKFVEEAYKLPASLRFGVAKDFHTVNDVMIFTVASDLVKYSDREYLNATGLETDIMKLFQVRLGYKTQKDSGSRVCGGFGMNFDRLSDKSGFLRGARMDYAYLDYGGLGATHRIGVQFVW